jgi:hypothetical protein
MPGSLHVMMHTILNNIENEKKAIHINLDLIIMLTSPKINVTIKTM